MVSAYVQQDDVQYGIGEQIELSTDKSVHVNVNRYRITVGGVKFFSPRKTGKSSLSGAGLEGHPPLVREGFQRSG